MFGGQQSSNCLNLYTSSLLMISRHLPRAFPPNYRGLEFWDLNAPAFGGFVSPALKEVV